MYAIASDHDYLEGSPEDRWLETIYVTKISEDQIKDIESSNFGRICKVIDITNFDKLANSLTVTTNLF